MNSFIICGDGQQFPITLNKFNDTRKISATVAEFADFDGDLVVKRGNRGLEFPLEFYFTGENYYENTQSFLNSLKDTRACVFYLPFAENGITCQVISLATEESFVNNVEAVKFNLTLHETLTNADFEQEFDGFLIETPIEFTDIVLTPKIQNIMSKIENRQFRLSFPQISGFIDSVTAKYTQMFMKLTNTPFEILQEMEKIRISLVNAKKTLHTSFSTTMFLLNAFMQFPKKLTGLFPASARATINFYKSVASDVIQRNADETANFTNFDNDYYNAVVAMSAFAAKEIIAGIDYQTTLTRRELVEMQKQLYKMYSDFIRTTQTPEDKAAGNYLISAMLEIDRIFSFAKIEKTYICEYPKDIYSLVGELYPATTPEEYETNFEKFVRDNELHAGELFLLPKGKKVVYYA